MAGEKRAWHAMRPYRHGRREVPMRRRMAELRWEPAVAALASRASREMFVLSIFGGGRPSEWPPKPQRWDWQGGTWPPGGPQEQRGHFPWCVVTLVLVAAAAVYLFLAPELMSLLRSLPGWPPRVERIELATRDIIYDPHSGLIFASVPSVDGREGGITWIDPVSGEVGELVPMSGGPGKLAVSDDGRWLYVGLEERPAIRRFDIRSRSLDMEFPLGEMGGRGRPHAEDIEVIPGQPGSVVVTLRNLGSSPRFAGVAVYDDGVRRPNVTPGFSGTGHRVNVIAFLDNPRRLYGASNSSDPTRFYRLDVDSGGIAVVDDSPNLLPGGFSSGDITSDAGRIYSGAGAVIDPEKRSLIGDFNTRGLVTADPASGHVIFLSEDTLSAWDPRTLAAFDSRVVPDVSGQPSSLVMWGEDSIAFRTNGGEVFLVDFPNVEPTVSGGAPLRPTNTPQPMATPTPRGATPTATPQGATPGTSLGTPSLVTGAYMQSSPGDWIGQGEVVTFTEQDGGFAISGSAANGISVNSGGWDFDFVPAPGEELATGIYVGVARAPFREPSEPGLSITGHGRGCNQVRGQFDVLALEFGDSGGVLTFAADFIHLCEKSPPALVGAVRYNAAIPVGLSPCRRVQLLGLNNAQGTNASGVYRVGSGSLGRYPEMDAYCDMMTDGGGWTLVLNYLHKGGTNPQLNVTTDTLPVRQGSTLGIDESGSRAWGHASNALMMLLPYAETMWYCKTSAHDRVIHFKNGASSINAYFRTGVSNGSAADYQASTELPLAKGAMLPLETRHAYRGYGQQAMTETPLFIAGQAHWGMRMEGSRWECDGYYPGSPANDTYHQLWVR